MTPLPGALGGQDLIAWRLDQWKHRETWDSGEGAFLAVLPRGPEVYDPFRHLDAAARRRRHILALMEGARVVSPRNQRKSGCCGATISK